MRRCHKRMCDSKKATMWKGFKLRTTSSLGDDCTSTPLDDRSIISHPSSSCGKIHMKSTTVSQDKNDPTTIKNSLTTVISWSEVLVLLSTSSCPGLILGGAVLVTLVMFLCESTCLHKAWYAWCSYFFCYKINRAYKYDSDVLYSLSAASWQLPKKV